MTHQVYKLSAFPKEKHGGNKAGVVVYADALSTDQKQQIAAKIGFSETAFVSKSDIADFKVEFFTPNSEVDLCGHATIATFNQLRNLGIISTGIYTQETKVGVLELKVEEDFVYMTQNTPLFLDEISFVKVNECFYGDIDVNPELPIQIVSTGIKEIFLPMRNQEELDHLLPNFEKIVKLSKELDVIGIHAFTLDDEVDAYSRNFAPLVGIPEESATGTSNGALGCYLYRYQNQKNRYILRQGYSMNKPSEIITIVETEGDTITKVEVGGTAVLLEEE